MRKSIYYSLFKINIAFDYEVIGYLNAQFVYIVMPFLRMVVCLQSRGDRPTTSSPLHLYTAKTFSHLHSSPSPSLST
jgi:hypothetical protein